MEILRRKGKIYISSPMHVAQVSILFLSSQTLIVQ